MNYQLPAKEKKRGIRGLFFIQIFSTLSFSVLYSTLVLYTTKGLNLDADVAVAITGALVAFNFFLHLLGGSIGGRFLSYRFLFTIGLILQTFGCIVLSIISLDSLYWGLAIFLAGCGLNLTCVNCMLTQLFEPHDKNRESAFLWNYSGMNIGFLIGFTMSGLFQIHDNYSTLFLMAALSNIITIGITGYYWKTLKDLGTTLSEKPTSEKIKRGLFGIVIIIALSLILRYFLKQSKLSNELILFAGGIMLLVIVGLILKQKTSETKKKMWAFFILTLSSLIFWTLYQMAPMGLTLFYQHNVNHKVLGFSIPPQWFMNINTIIIILGGPGLACLFKHLRKKGKTIRIPQQFAIALLLIGIGFIILPLGIHFANKAGLVSISWITMNYILQSLGEILLSPIGFSMIGQLIPTKLQGMMMGTWLMIVGVAATLSNYFSQMSFHKGDINYPLETNPTFSTSFNLLGWSAIGAAVILIILFPFLKRLIQEKTPHITPHPYNAPEDTP